MGLRRFATGSILALTVLACEPSEFEQLSYDIDSGNPELLQETVIGVGGEQGESSYAQERAERVEAGYEWLRMRFPELGAAGAFLECTTLGQHIPRSARSEVLDLMPYARNIDGLRVVLNVIPRPDDMPVERDSINLGVFSSYMTADIREISSSSPRENDYPLDMLELTMTPRIGEIGYRTCLAEKLSMD